MGSRQGKQETWGPQGYLIKDAPVGAAAISTFGSVLCHSVTLEGDVNPIPLNSIVKPDVWKPHCE